MLLFLQFFALKAKPQLLEFLAPVLDRHQDAGNSQGQLSKSMLTIFGSHSLTAAMLFPEILKKALDSFIQNCLFLKSKSPET